MCRTVGLTRFLPMRTLSMWTIHWLNRWTLLNIHRTAFIFPTRHGIWIAWIASIISGIDAMSWTILIRRDHTPGKCHRHQRHKSQLFHAIYPLFRWLHFQQSAWIYWQFFVAFLYVQVHISSISRLFFWWIKEKTGRISAELRFYLPCLIYYLQVEIKIGSERWAFDSIFKQCKC